MLLETRVKCGKAHRMSVYTKPPADAPTCYHCEGPHTASYRGYPELQKSSKQFHKPVRTS